MSELPVMTTRPSVALVHIAAIIGITPFAERNAAHAVFGQYTILIHNNLKYTFKLYTSNWMILVYYSIGFLFDIGITRSLWKTRGS